MARWVALFAACLVMPACNAGAPSSTGVLPPEPDDRPPVELVLEEAGNDPATNTTTIRAHLDARQPLVVPFELSVIVPENATLRSGSPSEKLVLDSVGRRSRDFVVTRGDARPIRVVVRATDPSGAFGYYAEKLWPPPENKPFARRAGAPGARPPVVHRPVGQEVAK